MRKLTVWLTALVIYSGSLAAQTMADSARREMAAIFNAYQGGPLMSLTIKSSLYLSDKPRVKIDSTTGSYYMQAGNVLGRISDGTSYLQNGTWSVLLMNQSRQMYIDSARPGKMDPRADPLLMAGATAFDSAASYSVYDIENGTRVIKAVLPAGSEVTEGKLFYNKATHRLVMAQYAMPYDESQPYSDTATVPAVSHVPRFYRLSMQFSEAYPDEPSGTLFSERQFFRKEGGRFVPADAYKGYSVITAFGDGED